MENVLHVVAICGAAEATDKDYEVDEDVVADLGGLSTPGMIWRSD